MAAKSSMLILPRSRFPSPLLLGNVGSMLKSNSLLFGLTGGTGSAFGMRSVGGKSGNASIVDADKGIGDAMGIVEVGTSWFGIVKDVDGGGSGTGIARCFDEGVDASCAAAC